MSQQKVKIISSNNQSINIDAFKNQDLILLLLLSQNEKCNCQLKFTNIGSNQNLDIKLYGLVKSGSQLKLTGEIDINKKVKNSQINWQIKIIKTKKAEVEALPFISSSSSSVKLNHGLAIADFDKEKIFYWQSRGMSSAKSKKIIAQNFFLSTLNKENLDKNEVKKLLNKI